MSANPKGTRYLTAEERAEFVGHVERVLQKRADDAAKNKPAVPIRRRTAADRPLEKPLKRLLQSLANDSVK